MIDIQETAIEHCLGDAHATVTAAEGTTVRMIRKLAATHPSDVQIIAENTDGSLLAHVPWKWVIIRPHRRIKLTEEQRKTVAERLAKARASKTNC